MITPQQFNSHPNYAGYFDMENYLEFIFEGFENPLPIERKLEIIKETGIKRVSPIQCLETHGVTIDFGFPRWERHIVLNKELKESDTQE